MAQSDNIALPNDHSIAQCWHPHYHQSPFKSRSAEIFRAWYMKEYGGNSSIGSIRRAAPLCVFGGVQRSPYVRGESASGTYAVCPACERVVMCGYNDDTGLGPRNCPKCNHVLALNDYFQPTRGGKVQNQGDFDPERDPAVTIAEACTLISDGIPHIDLAAIIAILADENLLSCGEFVDDLTIVNNCVVSGRIRERLLHWETEWAYVDFVSRRFNVKVTDRGNFMLQARGIASSTKARKRAQELVALDPKKLQALAWKSLANGVIENK